MDLDLDNLSPNVLEALKNLEQSAQPIQDPPLREIKAIHFGILSPEEITRMSVCEVNNSKISPPLSNTPYDELMGSFSHQKQCTTCGETVKHCPNHFGHIPLAIPILHPQRVSEIKSVLNCVCLNCSKLLLSEDAIDLEFSQTSTRIDKQHEYIKAIEAISVGAFCRHCPGNPNHPNVIISDGKKSADGKKTCKRIYKSIGKNKTPMSAQEIRTILEKIELDDLRIMGYNIRSRNILKHNKFPETLLSFRPEWMVLTVIPVLPPISRPPAFDGEVKNDDDLTTSYVEIIKRNEKLKMPNLNEKQREEIAADLELHIRTFIDNSDDKQKHTSGKPINSIKQRISGKKGHLRGKLLGKRVDTSCRTVITGDPTLKLNEVGVPIKIAQKITYPEKVTPRNISRLTEMLENDKITVVKRGDSEYNQSTLKLTGRKTRLQVGDIVFRHLQDGDRGVFNRQPTLHRGSMMSHIVKINPNNPIKTLRMNLAATKPYNADFDGDEMQLHIPQDYATVAELDLMDVTQMIVSSQSNRPIIGIIQDGLLGAYLMTKPVVYREVETDSEDAWPKNGREYPASIIRRERFYDILCSAGDQYPAKLPRLLERARKHYKEDELYNGKVLFSVALPENFNYTNGSVEIVKGILTKGAITIQDIGSRSHSIIHRLFNDYSSEVAAEFINAIQFIVNRWMLGQGHSVGVRDFVSSKKAEIIEKIHRAYIEVDTIVASNETAAIKEFKINNALNSHGQTLAVNGLCENNRLKTMVDSGSRGNNMNILQITAHLGQNTVEGKRIRYEIDDHQRTLPSFKRNYHHPRSRGFIEHSFMEGLNPEEFWFHAKAGREGVINTAVKTRDSGYSQRKLVKRMEDLIVQEDRTIRNSMGNIIQFTYGNDSMDPKSMYKGGVGFVDVDDLIEKLNDD